MFLRKDMNAFDDDNGTGCIMKSSSVLKFAASLVYFNNMKEIHFN